MPEVDDTPSAGGKVLHSLGDLRRSPSTQLWKLEIETILDGKRDHILEHLGDTADYVEEVIDNSTDPHLSRVQFYEALDYAVARWSPGRSDRYMIELLRRFTPTAGYARLIEMLESPIGLRGDPDLWSREPAGATLRLKALHALERYFPAPPLGRAEDSALLHRPTLENFYTYISLLRRHLRYPSFREYATQMLATLDSKISPTVLADAAEGSSRDLTGFYKRALKEGMAEQFIDDLAKRGAEVTIDLDAITINGVRERISPDSEVYSVHYGLFATRNSLNDSLERFCLNEV
jgi:hypothetical protein